MDRRRPLRPDHNDTHRGLLLLAGGMRRRTNGHDCPECCSYQHSRHHEEWLDGGLLTVARQLFHDDRLPPGCLSSLHAAPSNSASTAPDAAGAVRYELRRTRERSGCIAVGTNSARCSPQPVLSRAGCRRPAVPITALPGAWHYLARGATGSVGRNRPGRATSCRRSPLTRPRSRAPR